jgi:beta-glucanase (GH16 family)
MYVVTLALGVSLLSAAAFSADALSPPDTLPDLPQGQAWKLAFNDEFDGAELDASKWNIPDEYARRDGWWSPKAISFDGKGNLVISTLKEGDRYLDGCVRTRGKFEHAFGYYVARIRLQKQPGHWSAFWLYNDCVGKIGDEGRDGTEIDIYEKPWLDDRINYALHWDGYGKEHRSEGKVVSVPGVMEGYHTFSLWWKPDEYVFYVDGQEMWRTSAGGVCQAPLYIKLSDEIGTWAGKIADAQLPDAFLVDYVRVYDVVEGR